MLILGRREGDSILIEGGIRIVVVSCDRGGVRLGIEAPSDVKILRGEIAEKVVFLDQGVVRAEDTIERLSTQHDDARVRDFFRREGAAP